MKHKFIIYFCLKGLIITDFGDCFARRLRRLARGGFGGKTYTKLPKATLYMAFPQDPCTRPEPQSGDGRRIHYKPLQSVKVKAILEFVILLIPIKKSYPNHRFDH